MVETDFVTFKVSSALKNLIGKELITNDYVAVFELVKNSFDAKASNINVTIDLASDKIIIQDNGTGMSLDDIKNKWLFIGYSEKKGENTAYSGNKGIGRFSCDRLGSKLSLSTVKDGIKTFFNVNWTDYERDQSEDIYSLPIMIRTEITSESNGTTLEITQLRNSWDNDGVKKTKDQLLRLISPNKRDVKQHLSLFFVDKNGTKNEYLNLHNDVFEYMESKTAYVKATFNHDLIEVELYDNQKKVLTNVSKNDSLLNEASVQLFLVNSKAKRAFKQKTGMDLIRYGNLFVYRNSFRVYPYGELSFDSFGLSVRKTQGYNRYLGPREIIGWIDIVDRNNHFIESTSRDRGFIDNIYSKSLEEAYLEYIHKPLERYAQLLSYGNIKIDDYISLGATNIVFSELVKAFSNKNTISTDLDEQYLATKTSDKALDFLLSDDISASEKRKIIDDYKKAIKNKDKELFEKQLEINKKDSENKKLNKEIENKNRFLDVVNPSRQSVLEHDLGIVIKKMTMTLENLFEVNKSINNSRITKAINDLSWSIYRAKGIRNFILKTKMDTKTKKEIEVGSFFKEYSTLIDYEGIKISVFIEKEFTLKINVFDLITIFDNIVSNVDRLDGKKIDIYVKDNSIQFVSDTYRKVENAVDFTRVFDYGYSTNPDGTGLGMYFIKQICKQLGLIVTMYRLDNTNNVVTEVSRDA